jgi:hypothetical protein
MLKAWTWLQLWLNIFSVEVTSYAQQDVFGDFTNSKIQSIQSFKDAHRSTLYDFYW